VREGVIIVTFNRQGTHRQSRRSQLIATVGLIIFSIIAPGCSFSLAEDITPPPGSEIRAPLQTQSPSSEISYPMMPPDPSSGAPIFAEKCAPCHGPAGLGDGPQASGLPNPPAALGSPDVARQASPANWYNIVTRGNLERFMPPFNSLTDRQRWDVVAYALTLSISPEQIARGDELYEENCASCHGASGKGDGSEAASLAVPPTAFTDQQSMANRTGGELFAAIGAGIAPGMPAFADQLSEAERWDLVAFLRSLTIAAGESIAQAPTPGGTAEETAEGTEVPGTTQVPPSSSEAAGKGRISGQVVSATGNSQIPSDLIITLHGFDQMQEVLTDSMALLPDGSFGFEEVEMPEGRAFLASLEYQGVPYSSDVIVVEPGSTELTLPITFYETTTDLGVISVDRLHLLFEYIEPNTLRVIELYIISNQGDRIVVPRVEGEPVLTFTLPPGATNLQFEDGTLGERFSQTPGGFGDTAPIRPGASQHQVVYTYDLPYTRQLEFTHPFDLPVNAVVLLLPADGIKVNGDLLREMGPTEVQGITYEMYSTGRIEAGANLQLTVSGRPGGGAGLFASSGSGSGLVIGALAFGSALIISGIWLYRRNRKEPRRKGVGALEDQVSQERGSLYAAQDANTLMDAILALDDRYRAGELPEGAYRQRRAELKSRLKSQLGS
jgi:mono/diheme cytochrome c family protein